jgi:hypothetical protein
MCGTPLQCCTQGHLYEGFVTAMEMLFSLSALIVYPGLALVAGVLFLRMYLKLKSSAALVASVVWGLYFVYESLIKAGVLCTGECNIRVDLLLLYPLLLIISLVAIVLYYRKKSAGPSARR